MPTYYALLQDFKTVVCKTSLDRIREVSEPVAFILRQNNEEKTMVYGGTHTRYSYTAVDLSDKPSPIDLTDFTLIDVGIDQPSSQGVGRTLTFKEKSTGESRTFYTHNANGSAEVFIKSSLVEYCQQLEKVRSYHNYELLEQIQDLTRKNEQLEARIKQLTEAK